MMNSSVYNLGEYYLIINNCSTKEELIKVADRLLYLKEEKLINVFEQMVLSAYLDKKEFQLTRH